ncbi:MAG TPA: hypothetical protein VGJ30_10420 [Candidatus Angelobacter sp.]
MNHGDAKVEGGGVENLSSKRVGGGIHLGRRHHVFMRPLDRGLAVSKDMVGIPPSKVHEKVKEIAVIARIGKISI